MRVEPLATEEQHVTSANPPKDWPRSFNLQIPMLPSILRRAPGARVFRKCVGKPFLVVNEWVWNRLPSAITASRPMRFYGTFLHRLVEMRSARRQYHGTFFLR